jgi:hypothetical protein
MTSEDLNAANNESEVGLNFSIPSYDIDIKEKTGFGID